MDYPKGDPTADVETAQDWERTFADIPLTGNWANDVLAIASSQLGYTESERNYVVTDNGVKKGYTRYGEWYGSPYSHWCAIFVSFCLDYAYVEGVPYEASCQRWIEKLQQDEYALWRDPDNYMPAPGDLVFFNLDDAPDSDHVGLVYALEETEDSQQIQLTTIEGNTGGRVRYETYTLPDSSIIGYGQLPQNPNEAPMAGHQFSATIYSDASYSAPVERNESQQTRSRAAAEAVPNIILRGTVPDSVVAKAYPVDVAIDGETVVCAYDITLFNENGTVYEPEEGSLITVTYELPGFTEESDMRYSVYHIPDNGEAPVRVEDADVNENAMVFTTDHFSVYAWTSATAGNMSAVYIDGVNGSDSTGTGTSAAPVKTFARAIELLAQNGTIYISNTVSITDTQTWSLADSGAMIKRAAGFSGELVHIASSGSLTLQTVTMNGDNQTAYAPLIVNEGNLVLSGNSVLQNNNNQGPLTQRTSAYPYRAEGGAVWSSGNVTVNGATITGCAAQSGGGIYAEGSGSTDMAQISILNGVFTSNIAQLYTGNPTPSPSNLASYKANGGAIYIGEYVDAAVVTATFNGNRANNGSGGAISMRVRRVNESPSHRYDAYVSTLDIGGGNAVFTNNYAWTCGGAITVNSGCYATVSQGLFQYNHAQGAIHSEFGTGGIVSYAGGAIYVDSEDTSMDPNGYEGVTGSLDIYNLEMTRNEDGRLGGGYAGCRLSTLNIEHGSSLIYGNYQYDVSMGRRSSSDISISQKLSGRDSDEISNIMLGGGAYDWEYRNGNGNVTEQFNSYSQMFNEGGYYSGRGATYWKNGTGATQAMIDAAQPLIRVRIIDNTANVGAGIANNGKLHVLATSAPAATTSATVAKVWNDNNDASGQRPTSVQVQLYAGATAQGAAVTLNAGNGWTHTWTNLPVKDSSGNTILYTVTEVGVPNGYTSASTVSGTTTTITNTKTATTTSADVVKVWNGDTAADRPAYVDVQLYSTKTVNGQTVKTTAGSSVQLSAASDWAYAWTDLPGTDNSGNTLVYSVEEVNVPNGYTSASTVSGTTTTITNTKTVETTEASVTKVWSGDTAADRPVYVEAQLYSTKTVNGQTVRTAIGDPVQLSSAGSWTYSWTNLPATDNDGSALGYTVEEVNIPIGYTSTVTASASQGNAFTITNTKATETTGATVTKTWNDNNDAAGMRPDSIQVQLYADGMAYGSPVTLSANNGWSYTWQNIAKKTAGGADISYTVSEVNTPDGYTVSVTASGAASSDWEVVTAFEDGGVYRIQEAGTQYVIKDTGVMASNSTLGYGALSNTSDLKTQWRATGSASTGYILQNVDTNKKLTITSWSASYVSLTASTGGTAVSYTNSKLFFTYSYLNYPGLYYNGVYVQAGTANTHPFDSKNVTLYKQQQSGIAFTMTNTFSTQDISLRKLDGDTQQVLPGATFTVYERSADSNAVLLFPADPLHGYDEIKGVPVSGCTSMVIPQTGEVDIDGLLTGRIYYLVETQSPSGYNRPTEPVIFRVTADGTVEILNRDGTTATGNSVATGGAAVLQIRNYPGYELPSTGGHGVLPYTIAGCLLLAGAACGLYIKTKQRRKEDY